jgi:hypothetical protein
LLVADPDTGEALPVREAPDRALLTAAARVRDAEGELRRAKQALAEELRDRHGLGASSAGGFGFVVTERESWPQLRTQDALDRLVAGGRIGAGDAARCMPSKPVPDKRQLDKLLAHLGRHNPDAAAVLRDALTVAAPSVGGVRPDAVDTTEAA